MVLHDLVRDRDRAHALFSLCFLREKRNAFRPNRKVQWNRRCKPSLLSAHWSICFFPAINTKQMNRSNNTKAKLIDFTGRYSTTICRASHSAHVLSSTLSLLASSQILITTWQLKEKKQIIPGLLYA